MWKNSRVRSKIFNHPAKGGPLPEGAASFINDTYMKKPKGPGIGRALMPSLGIAAAIYMTDYRQKYGTGFAVAYGIASSTPILWVGTLAAELGISTMDYGYHKYHEKRRLNMGQPMLDTHGTRNAMRMNSLQKMQRGHNSIHRGIGNEAQHFHKR
jgi:hypothetical protein